MPSEQEFLAALQRGDETAFRRLVDEHQKRVLNTCLGFLPQLHDAQDLTQEVFIEAWSAVGNFRGESAISTWLYRIAVNKCLEKLRYRRRKKRVAFYRALIGLDDPSVQALGDEQAHPGIALENRERAAVLFAHLERLPENQKAALVLHKIEGLSHWEIAEVLGVSAGAIESLLHRAKKNLQVSLVNFYKNESA